MYNFHEKKFRITLIEGSDTEVSNETLFEFQQDGYIVKANYSGGKVRYGYLIGVISGDKLHHRYIQINHKDEINSGEGNSIIEINSENKLEIIEEWEWQNKPGKGKSIMTEQ